ncbi:MAG TPA: DinB family protein [Gemmatimonadales bacterium]
MTPVSIPRPAADEAAPYYQRYIARVSGENIGEQLVDQLAEVERLLGPLDDTAALARYAPGKWSVKEILGHLADVERIFSYRLLRISRGDVTPLPGFDENAYVPIAEFDKRLLRDLAAEFRAVRLSTIALLNGLPSDSWSRRGSASGNPVSARALAYIIVGHVSHHLGVLRDRYGLGSGAATTSFAGNR